MNGVALENFEIRPYKDGDVVEGVDGKPRVVSLLPTCKERRCIRQAYDDGRCKLHADLAWYRAGMQRVYTHRKGVKNG